jgi:hypothetical protein
MTRQELRVALSERGGVSMFCGCGSPEAACAALLRLCRLHPLFNNREEFRAWLPDDGVQMLMLGLLDGREWNEHGGSIDGAWLTPEGEAFRDALAREEADGFVSLNAMHCVHGYDTDDESHDCMAVDRAERAGEQTL